VIVFIIAWFLFVEFRQAGFSVLSLALTSQSLNLATSLFEDAGVEIHDSSPITPAKLDILVSCTALQRVAKIFEVADGLIHFFFILTPIIYRKVMCFGMKTLNEALPLLIGIFFLGMFFETSSQA